MRILFIACISLGLIFTAHAQNFHAPLSKPSKRAAARGEANISQPAPTGIIYMMSKDGFEVINPWADPSLGIGEKVLTKNIAAEEGNYDPEEKNKQFGGIVFFGYTF